MKTSASSPPPTLPKIIENEKFLFSILLILQVIFFAWLMYTKRAPGGHDGLQYFALQYYFLNEAVNTGDIAQWLPFMTQGTISNWWYFVQAGIFQNILLLTGPLFKNINFVYLFNIGMFIDELLLLVGCWLLARRFFRSFLTVTFVTASVMSSCIWMTQPWFNLHLYYALPLILHLIHAFIEKGQWRYLIMAGNLMILQILGSMPYFLPVITLVIFLYFLFYFLCQWNQVKEQVSRIPWHPRILLGIGLLAISLWLLYAVLHIGSEEIRNYNFGRDIHGTSTLANFLSYGGNLNFYKWQELIWGFSPTCDYTLYIGFLGVILIIFSLLSFLEKRHLHFLLLTVLILWISVGGFPAKLFYHIWPMMKFYRHLVLLSPLAKLFLCFLAGFGLEILIEDRSKRQRFLFIAIVALSIVGVSLARVTDLDIMKRLPQMVAFDGKLVVLYKIFSNGDYFERVYKSCLLAPLFAFLLFFLKRSRSRTFSSFVLLLLLVTHMADVYSYKFSESSVRSMPLDHREMSITRFQAMPFPERREAGIIENALVYEEMKKKADPRFYFLENQSVDGALNCSLNSFLFLDQVTSPFRTDFWMAPFDRFMRAYWGQPINDTSIPPEGLVFWQRLKFSPENISAQKFMGLAEDKIQFFKNAHFRNEEDIAPILAHKAYKGDTLFVSGSHAGNPDERVSLNANDRLNLSYRVTGFSSNRFMLEANIPYSSAWLLYSDVWHPFWKAFVNGKEVKVERGSLAYKTIKLERGLNHIQFVFKAPFFIWIHCFWALNGIACLCILGWQMISIFKEGPKRIPFSI